MSIPVDPKDLAGALTDFEAGYLLTVSAEGRIKAVTVEPTASSDALVIDGVSKGSARNLADNPQVTVIFPPRERHGFTLIVDGTAAVTEETIRVVPEAAVLHRPASHADEPLAAEGCGNDCRPVRPAFDAAGAAGGGGDYEYDLAHEFTGATEQRPDAGPVFPARPDAGRQQGGDWSYDLAHEVGSGS